MKKVIISICAVILMLGCSKAEIIESEAITHAEQTKTKTFKFTIKGDFTSITFTRATTYLSGSENSLTDLWVYDYVDGECKNEVHQVPTDENWGRPSMSLTYGTHHVYFVASRGTNPTVTATSIAWEKPSDTYWTDYEVNVQSSSNGNRAVTLNRVATKMKITATDEVPEGAKTLTITPDTWYYGIDYVTGNPNTAKTQQNRSVEIPSSYIGTTGLTMSIFGLSGTDEWQTNMRVSATDANGNVVGETCIENVPFVQNRATEYSGPLFGSSGNVTVLINDEWTESYTGAW